MTAVKFSPIGNDVMWFSNTGLVANGGKLFFYTANSSTKLDTYTTSAGSVANSNPVVLGTYGKSATQIWLQEGQQYKVVLAPASDTDPPTSGITLGDYITGINDTGVVAGVDQWIASGLTPTYVSATSFTLSGDQTTAFHVGRRLKTTNTGGTIYSTITVSSYTAPNTTVTVVNDSGTLDSGLSAVSYSMLTSTNPSIPKVVMPDGSTAATQTAGDSTAKLATTAFVTGAIATSATTNKHNATQDFRLTLTTGTPVTTSDVTASTSVYLTPYTGNKMGVYNGSSWDILSSAELTLAIGNVTAGIGFDVFAYSNFGVLAVEKLAWTSATARATALTYQDGILVKSGDATRRYIGSFLSATTTQTKDSASYRYLYNYYHRVLRYSAGSGFSATHDYTTATWRPFENLTPAYTAAYSANFFIGVLEDHFDVIGAAVSSSNGGGNARSTSYGLNQTTAPSGYVATMATSASHAVSMPFSGKDFPTLGYNYIALLEYSVAVNISTWTTGTTGSSYVAATIRM